MKIKRGIKAAAFCIILIIFLNYIYQIFSWKDTAGDYVSSMKAFYELEDDLVDVLFLGSSRCYCSINNAVLWDEYGISSFSMAISGQDIASSYYCFEEALKTQTPDVVCFELYGTTFAGYLVESNMYRNTLSYRLSLNAVKAAKSIAGDRAAELLLRWPVVHTRYAELQKEDFETDYPAYIGYTAGFHTSAVGELWSYVGEETEPIGVEEEKWLRKIIALAEEKDIELCFFVAPAVCTELEQKKYNYVEDIAENHGIPVVNMAKGYQELGLDLKNDFIDFAHTNYYGSQKVSQFMADFLKRTYSLADRRAEEGYELWQENSIARKHEYLNELLFLSDTMEEYLHQLADLKEYTVIVFTAGDYACDNPTVEAYVNTLGLESFYDAAGIWVLEDQKQSFCSVGEDILEYMDLQKEDLLVSGVSGTYNAMINRQSCRKTENGINIVVYDNVLKKIVDIVGFEKTAGYEMRR